MVLEVSISRSHLRLRQCQSSMSQVGTFKTSLLGLQLGLNGGFRVEEQTRSPDLPLVGFRREAAIYKAIQSDLKPSTLRQYNSENNNNGRESGFLYSLC